MIPQRQRDRSLTPLSAEERDEVAAVASAAERSNRPVALVVLAGLVFVIACAVLGVSATRQAAASAEVDRREAELEEMRGLVIEYFANEGSGDEIDDLPPTGQGILSRIEELARDAGIEGDLGLAGAGTDRVTDGVVLARGTYSLRHDNLTEIMDWVGRVERSIQGVQVRRLSLRPQPRNSTWQFEIRFERYERAN